ncbi:hypothetical protein GCM10010174_25880 [Kutzneria viridogrisea]|uniref:DUF427 domain-containing protein n=1 Tax=Kutzneria viridogrisea TaxID=47990 RepID=A0ABR6BRV0_9PSEU|nr:hypothetical protein [Kutzneria viridogrisea]
MTTWHVETITGSRYALPYTGNGGWGPVTVWDNGALTELRWRHRFPCTTATAGTCPICVDPSAAQVYLPSLRWTTEAGRYCSLTEGGPQYGYARLRVYREDAWYRWVSHASVDLDVHTDLPAQIDTWRATHTDWTPPVPPVAAAPDEIRTGAGMAANSPDNQVSDISEIRGMNARIMTGVRRTN